MFGLYTKKKVKKLTAELKAEYEETLQKQRETAEELKAENRTLQARVLELENERSGAIAAFQAAERERGMVREEGERTLENDRRELALLKQKCRLMLQNLQEKYPDEEDARSFAAFMAELGEEAEEEEDTGFNLEDVTAPKGPLDLKQLCLDLGLTEDDDEG